jgi:hypothetical protein
MTKHTKFKKSLHLNTETVRSLSDKELAGAGGGALQYSIATVCRCWSQPVICHSLYGC